MIHALHTSADPALRSAARRAGAAGRARWPALRRGLQHGRVARDSVAAQDDESRYRGVARDVRADGRCGSRPSRSKWGWCWRRCCSSAGWRTRHRWRVSPAHSSRKGGSIRCRESRFPITPRSSEFTVRFSSVRPTSSRRSRITSRRSRRSSSCDCVTCRRWMRQACRRSRISPIRCGLSGRTLLLCGARQQPAHLMERAEFHEHVGDANILPNVHEALTRARRIAQELDLEQEIRRSGAAVSSEIP